MIAGLSGGTSETIQPGRTGELVSCDGPDALAEATMALLDAPERRAAMGRCARQWAVERFDWDILTRQAYAVFTGSS